MCVTGWSEGVFNEMDEVVKRGINTFKHFMAYKGALMVNDDEMFASFQRCAALGAYRWSTPRTGTSSPRSRRSTWTRASPAPKDTPTPVRRKFEGEATNRAIMIADAAGVPVYIVHTSCEQAHEAIRRARQKCMRVYGEPLVQHLTLDETEYTSTATGTTGRRVMSPRPSATRCTRTASGGSVGGVAAVWVATDHCAFTTEQKRFGLKGFPAIPTAPEALRTACPCSGPRASRPAASP